MTGEGCRLDESPDRMALLDISPSFQCPGLEKHPGVVIADPGGGVGLSDLGLIGLCRFPTNSVMNGTQPETFTSLFLAINGTSGEASLASTPRRNGLGHVLSLYVIDPLCRAIRA